MLCMVWVWGIHFFNLPHLFPAITQLSLSADLCETASDQGWWERISLSLRLFQITNAFLPFEMVFLLALLIAKVSRKAVGGKISGVDATCSLLTNDVIFLTVKLWFHRNLVFRCPYLSLGEAWCFGWRKWWTTLFLDSIINMHTIGTQKTSMLQECVQENLFFLC